MIELDSRELVKLDAAMKRYEHIMPRSVAASALRRSAKPMFRAAKNLVPVGNDGREYISLKHAKNANANEYRRGGATKRDLRIKTVKGEQGEVGRVLIGVSSKKGKVGWRTHFITRGFTDRSGKKHEGNDFLQLAYDESYEEVKNNFLGELRESFKKWAAKNLPQGRV